MVAKLIAPNPDGVVIDGTYGRGGHTRGVMAALSGRGRMHAFDMDSEAVKDGKALAAQVCSPVSSTGSEPLTAVLS